MINKDKRIIFYMTTFYLEHKFSQETVHKSHKTVNLQQVLLDWVKKVKTPANIKLNIDIDPFSFM